MSAFGYVAADQSAAADLIDFLDLVSPAAGANYTYPLSRELAVRVLAARATLTTDANVANRLVSLDYMKSGGATYVRNAPAAVQVASVTGQQYEWSANLGLWDGAANAPSFVPVLPIWLPPGFAIRFTVDAIQATDQLSGLKLVLERAAPSAA